jgi:hypothetical protein
MIKIKQNLNKLKDIIKIIENINPEMTFVFCQEGILVRAVDTSQISMAIFRIKKELFEEYNITEKKVCTFQVSMISKILKKVGTKELLITPMKNMVDFKTSKDKFSLKFFVGTEDEREEPNVEGASSWDINPNDFFTLINDFKTFNDTIKCESLDNNLYIGTKGEIIEGISLTESVPIKTENTFCKYPIAPFQMISNIKNIFDTMQFQFSYETPCQLSAENEDLKFKWVLAPRVNA